MRRANLYYSVAFVRDFIFMTCTLALLTRLNCFLLKSEPFERSHSASTRSRGEFAPRAQAPVLQMLRGLALQFARLVERRRKGDAPMRTIGSSADSEVVAKRGLNGSFQARRLDNGAIQVFFMASRIK